MDFSVIDVELTLMLLLLLLVGMGPKIALVPFLEKTKGFDNSTRRAVGQQMVVTAVATALVLFATGALLMRLLQSSPSIWCLGQARRRWKKLSFKIIRNRSRSTHSRYPIYSTQLV
jgi:multiple antibiotic resistance protein